MPVEYRSTPLDVTDAFTTVQLTPSSTLTCNPALLFTANSFPLCTHTSVPQVLLLFRAILHGCHACACTTKVIIETTDAGQTWIEKKYDCGALYSINFPSTSIGYMLGAPEINGIRKLWKTIDGGVNWLLSEYEVGMDYYSTSCYGLKLLCTDTNTCYIITNYGTVLKTINGGGNNWMVGLENNTEKSIDFSIYPNPAQTLINIEFENASSKNYTLSIVNVLGQTVYSKQTSDSKLQISVDEFPSGIYSIQVSCEKKSMSTKFIKQ